MTGARRLKKQEDMAEAVVADSQDVDWSNLPGDILHEVLMQLNLVDFHSFACVCSMWKSVAVDSKKAYASSLPPLLHVALSTPNPYHDAFYSLVDHRCYYRKECVGGLHPGAECIHPADKVLSFSCGYWIVKGAQDRLFLVHPLVGRVVTNDLFPPMNCSLEPGDLIFLTAPPESTNCIIVAVKSTLSHPTDSVADWDLITGPEFLMIRYCRPGDSAWIVHNLTGRSLLRQTWLGMHLFHSAVVEGKLYATWKGYVVIVFSFIPNFTIDIMEVRGPLPFGPFWLVESDGKLFLVKQTGTLRFEVYQLDVRQSKWVPVETLGTRTLFINQNVNPVCCDASAWGGPADCIYFESSNRVLEIYHIEDGRTECVAMPGGMATDRDGRGIVLLGLCCSLEF